MKNNIKSKIIFALLIPLTLILVVVFREGDETAEANYDSFAQCLTAKDYVMYGAEWCPHCQNEKKAFGSSFKYINYVECPDNPKLCTDKGINGFPTWISGDKFLEGEQGLEKLSSESGCPLQ